MGAPETKPDVFGQLGAEARELERDTSAETREREGATGGAAGAPQDEAKREGAPGSAPEVEVVSNPAPLIAATLKGARDFPLTARVVPAHMLAQLDDATLDELAGALGELTVKHGPALARWFSVGERYAVEARAAKVFVGLALRLYLAAHADDEAARAGRAADVSPGAPGAQVDPPNPAAGQKPVEPGG